VSHDAPIPVRRRIKKKRLLPSAEFHSNHALASSCHELRRGSAGVVFMTDATSHGTFRGDHESATQAGRVSPI